MDSELMFRVSAKRGINRPEILGPTVYRKTREVEFTIFLPFKILVIDNLPGYKELLDALLESIVGVLQGAGVNTKGIERNKAELIRIILSDRNMFEFE